MEKIETIFWGIAGVAATLLMTVIYIYAAGALLMALRLGWHMLFKLDRYDWYYSKGDILMSFALSVFLWPLMLIKWRNLIDPGKLFESRNQLAARMRLLDHPPLCGSVVQYCQKDSWGGEMYGEFFFRAADVEQNLRERLAEAPHLKDDDEGGILNWVRRRDETLTEPTGVPLVWGRFEFVANDLIRAGNATVRCLKCGAEFSMDQLVTNDDHGRRGWNFDQLTCPQGHDLLVVQKFHLLMSDGQ